MPSYFTEQLPTNILGEMSTHFSGDMPRLPTYFTAHAITYTCNSGYSQRTARDIACICNVINEDDWSCSIPDFENECEKGWC